MLIALPPIAPVAPLPPATLAAAAAFDAARDSSYPTGASKSTLRSVSTIPTAFAGFNSFTASS